MADYFVWYLERDVLGKLANLHLALCDQYGPKGPLADECLTLSHLQAVAVDFAKHGECVSHKEYNQISKLVREWPDFFEKEQMRMRKSHGVLGQLYRDISNEQAMEAYLKNDYKHAILLDYKLDPRILSLPANVAEMHRNLHLVYRKLVVPMTQKVQKLMAEFCFATEAELFASDLHYKFCDDSMGKKNLYRNDEPMKHEDLMDRLKGKLSKLISSYQAKFAELVKIQSDLLATEQPFAPKDMNVTSA